MEEVEAPAGAETSNQGKKEKIEIMGTMPIDHEKLMQEIATDMQEVLLSFCAICESYEEKPITWLQKLMKWRKLR